MEPAAFSEERTFSAKNGITNSMEYIDNELASAMKNVEVVYLPLEEKYNADDIAKCVKITVDPLMLDNTNKGFNA